MALAARPVLDLPDSPSAAAEIPMDPGLRFVFRKLAAGRTVDDAYFDRIYPEWARNRSRKHWTPLPVVQRVVQLLEETRPVGLAPRILDVGSGAGKFGLAAATLGSGIAARVTGVEQRPHLVALSRRLAGFYRVPRLSFVEGQLADVDWIRYDVVYLFNPFQEHRTPDQCIDRTIPLDRGIADRFVRETREKLFTMPRGTRVVTYFGFGGEFPAGFVRRISEFCFRGPLELWERE